MRRFLIVGVVSIAIVSLISIFFVDSVGAQSPKAKDATHTNISPRYSTQFVGATLLLVTDNQTNIMYAYQDIETTLHLKFTVDLNDVGKDQIKEVIHKSK